MKTLVIVSHPYPDFSNSIKALENVARESANVEVRNLESLYGNDSSKFDIAAEQAACEQADRIVYLFPVHWFNITPMLKAYLNEVWSYGWAYGQGGEALQGKKMQVITTTGAVEQAYSRDAHIQCSIDDVLSPMKASALYVGMEYQAPIVFFDAMGPAADKLDGFKKVVAETLA